MNEQHREEIKNRIAKAKAQSIMKLINALETTADAELIELAVILRKDERVIRLLNKNQSCS